MNSQRDIEYDLKEKASEEIRDIILLSAYSKHIIHTILKINPTGEKYITESDWTFLSLIPQHYYKIFFLST